MIQAVRLLIMFNVNMPSEQSSCNPQGGFCQRCIAVTASFALLGMAAFLRNISFHGILLDALFEPGSSDWQAVYSLVSNGIRDGTVRPLETTVFERDDIETAFRFMAQGKHIGKVLIKVNCLR